MIRQNYNLIEGINSNAEAKRFTYWTMQRNIIMSILRRCKKITSCYFSWCKFSYMHRSLMQYCYIRYFVKFCQYGLNKKKFGGKVSLGPGRLQPAPPRAFNFSKSLVKNSKRTDRRRAWRKRKW